MFWKIWILGNLRFFHPRAAPWAVAEAKHFWNKSSSLLPHNATVYWEKNTSSAVGGGQEWEQMAGRSWLVSSEILHFSSFLGPCSCASQTPASLGPGLLPRVFLWLGVFWVFCGGAFRGSAPVKCWMGAPVLPYGAAWDFPSLASYVTFKVRLELPILLLVGGSTFSAVAFSSGCSCLCPNLPTATFCLGGWDVVIIRLWGAEPGSSWPAAWPAKPPSSSPCKGWGSRWWCCPKAGVSLFLGMRWVRNPEVGGLQLPTSLESN